jgi:hypothetical protein
MTQEALKLVLQTLELSKETMESACKQIDELKAENKSLKEALAKEKTLQAFHSENEHLGLYKDSYAQPKQEPVAYLCEPDENGLFGLPTPDKGCKDCFPVYRQRTWVDLTRTQMQDVYFAVLEEHRGGHQMEGQLAFGEALQAKIREKNT